jgi:hypothetical protein
MSSSPPRPPSPQAHYPQTNINHNSPINLLQEAIGVIGVEAQKYLLSKKEKKRGAQMDSRLIYGPVESFSMYCSLASILFKVREFDGNVYQNRKIFKAQFELPPYDFVQFQAARHQPRLTDTIWPPVIRVPWFCKGFSKQLMFSIKEDKAHARRRN